jgi:hypothetical protein
VLYLGYQLLLASDRIPVDHGHPQIFFRGILRLPIDLQILTVERQQLALDPPSRALFIDTGHLQPDTVAL